MGTIYNYRVVIPAAGQGKRMQANKNKQFILLAGMPVIVHTVLAFQRDTRCQEIILVVNAREKAEFDELVSTYQLSKVKKIIIGGQERQDSVYAGLKAISAEGNELVLVHDGARPFVSAALISKVVQKAAATGAAIAAVPVTDTIKRVEQEYVVETFERSSLWAVQTPQAFQLSKLLTAHEEARLTRVQVTDDAALMEASGHRVAIVEGDRLNIKLTTPHDLLIAQVILKDRERKL